MPFWSHGKLKKKSVESRKRHLFSAESRKQTPYYLPSYIYLSTQVFKSLSIKIHRTDKIIVSSSRAKYPDGLRPVDYNDIVTGAELDEINSDNLEDYIGTNVGFYKILKMYEERFESKYGGDVDKFIAGELPRIIDGPTTCLFHGIIQLANGYVGKNWGTVREGMAMGAHQYTGLFPDDPGNAKFRDVSRFGRGNVDILDSFKKMRDDKERLMQSAQKEVKNPRFKEFPCLGK